MFFSCKNTYAWGLVGCLCSRTIVERWRAASRYIRVCTETPLWTAIRKGNNCYLLHHKSVVKIWGYLLTWVKEAWRVLASKSYNRRLKERLQSLNWKLFCQVKYTYTWTPYSKHGQGMHLQMGSPFQRLWLPAWRLVSGMASFAPARGKKISSLEYQRMPSFVKVM